ncbi:MAG: aminotransferase class III-fold pyridoxal phosphate-dependent enzyme, partial [Verrucomicrobia bacterium]|nr:aminotransferase class III-fold pyridoxal phosphate-dependent enzyme [Verrucomicrobiota bacterium]
ISHSSALGLANAPASLLAERLVKATRLKPDPQSAIHNPKLRKVFFSDDGSTAMEVALKMAHQFARRTGLARRPRFLSMDGGYHGDTIGAVSLGHINLFHKTWNAMLFKTDRVMAPYCYRCPFNRAQPERVDAREHRQCHWECVDQVEKACAVQRRKRGEPYAGFVFEPRMQGAAGLIAQPHGWLKRSAQVVRGHRSLLIADEVMTGFGRVSPAPRGPLWASHVEGVQPDLAALAKGMTGGYLPMAATLTTQAIFDAFLGEYEEFKTFFHGHSFTGNQLGAAAALANLDLLGRATTRRRKETLEATLRQSLAELWSLPAIGDIRQEGCVAGIELVRDWRNRTPFDLRERAGLRVGEAMARRGVLTRPVGNVVVLMPPYCTTAAQTRRIVRALKDSVQEVFGK